MLTDTSSTPRLLYEPLRRTHGAELAPVLCDPRLYEWIPGPHPHSAEELGEEFGRRQLGPPDGRLDERWFNCVVRLRDGGQAIGRLEATVIEQRAEVAYLFGFDFWGFGYATEALRGLQDALAKAHAVTEFWATATPGNLRSLRLLRRCGYREAAPSSWPPLASYDPGDVVLWRPSEAGSADGAKR